MKMIPARARLVRFEVSVKISMFQLISSHSAYGLVRLVPSYPTPEDWFPCRSFSLWVWTRRRSWSRISYWIMVVVGYLALVLELGRVWSVVPSRIWRFQVVSLVHARHATYVSPATRYPSHEVFYCNETDLCLFDPSFRRYRRCRSTFILCEWIIVFSRYRLFPLVHSLICTFELQCPSFSTGGFTSFSKLLCLQLHGPVFVPA